MKLEKFKILFNEFGDEIVYKQNLKKKNWFNIGGNSKVYFKANNLRRLVEFVTKLEKNEKLFTLGAGSNTLISDSTFDGVVIKLGNNFRNISLLKEDVVIAGCATLDRNLSNFAANNNISGFEFLSCIPGTIGGGIKMNAGCFGQEFKDILISVQALDRTGHIKTIFKKDIQFEYRGNNLPEDLIFLSATFKGKKKDRRFIEEEIKNLTNIKNKNQPMREKTGGSTFKNPINQTKKKVWELIRDTVPIDKKFGDAYISNKHCNFFINKGNASFEDMKNLIDYVSIEVFKKTGIKLEKEIKILE